MPSLRERISLAANALLGRETRALPNVNTLLYSGWGVPAPFKPEESLDAYGYNVWVYRAVLTIAMELARVPLRLREPTATGFKNVERHQALDTLARPQETKLGKCQLSGMMLRVVTGMHLMLNGESFWVFQKRMSDRLGAAPTYIDIAMPQYMYEKLDRDSEIEKYVYRVPHYTAHEIELDPLDVCHFRLPDPKNLLRGHSPIQSIGFSIDTQRQADLMNTKKLSNGGIPPGTLETDQPIPQAEREKLAQQWQRSYGGASNAGKVPVMPNGLHFNRISESNQDMQFVQGKEVTRDEILANYGMGMEILGKTDSQTRANADAAIFVFQRFGVLPFLELFVDGLNNDYLPAFPGTENLQFTFDDPVPENVDEKRQNIQTGFGVGAFTPNEVRVAMGKDPLKIPGMDTTYLPINMMPVGEDPVAPNAPAN